jgi:hypothetical protein
MKLINQPQVIEKLTIKGNRKPHSIGACIQTHGDIDIDYFDGSHVLVPLIHLGGILSFEELILHHFGGDGINARSNDGLYITYLKVRDDEIWLDNKKYHPDVLQGYAVKEDGHTIDPKGIVGNIWIEHVDIVTTNPNRQIFMFSEACENSHIHIGTKSLKVHCIYPYWFVANTLKHATLGNLDNVDLKLIGGKKGEQPKIRIGNGKSKQFDKKHGIKASTHRTRDVITISCGTDNLVPDTVTQT